MSVTPRSVVRLLAWVAIIAGLIVLVRALPTARALDFVQYQVAILGPWGPLVFGVAYFIAALLFVPGSALTLAAGAIFGLGIGTATVSVSSTAAAGASFVIARYLAREKVRKMAESNRTFGAIDQAIAQGGWRIIALLRLSPAVPFSLGNYLYGLTPVRFWPYLLASWIAMLPGTFLYVYLGHVGRTAAGGTAGNSPWKIVLLVAGLLATAVVTVYITRLARKALKESSMKTLEADDASPTEPKEHTRKPVGKLIAAASIIAVLAASAQANRARLGSLLGPPRVTLQETFTDSPDGAVFDHSTFDALLHEHVDEDGFVDYLGLQQNAASLDTYIASLDTADVESLGRDEHLAFLINAYNSFTLRLILDNYPLESIKDISTGKRWDAKRWSIAGTTYSLNQIEHELIRPKFAEPRIHFALVCAAVGCPPLRAEAYTGIELERQLLDQAAYVHSHDRWIRVHADLNEVELTSLYQWYGSDFEQVAGSVLAFAQQYSSDLSNLMKDGGRPKVNFLDYDWNLNDQGARR